MEVRRPLKPWPGAARAVLVAVLAGCAAPPTEPEKPAPPRTHFELPDIPPAPQPRVTTIGSPERRMADWLESRRGAMIDLLKKLVNVNSGSLNRDGIAKVLSILQEELRRLGFEGERTAGGTMKVLRCPERAGEIRFGDHFVARRKGKGSRHVLLVGHVDTVFGPEHPFQKFSVEGRKVRGPGVADMKGGLVIMLFALKALAAEGRLRGPLTVLLNSDEELGSLDSRPLLEREARRHDVGLVFEPATDNEMVRIRKGLGQVRIVVRGRAAHAGAAHGHGISAVRELAHKVAEIEKLTDYGSGVTVNVGIIEGGEARNTVPPCAEAFVDLRYPTPEAGEYLVRSIREIVEKAYTHNRMLDRSPEAEMWHALHRPPKLPTKEFDSLLAMALGIGQGLGKAMPVTKAGGGTDGNLLQAAGLPTLDTLGPVGDGAHSPREEMDLDLFVWRAKLAAILLYRLTRGTR